MNRGRNPGSIAILDVWAFGRQEIRDVLLDVTHRHPMKLQCQSRAATEDGCCCRLAAEDKEAGYPAAGGRSITTACIESWGRCGQELEQVLTTAAAAASRQDRQRGHAPSGRLSVWRARLDAISQRAAALAMRFAREGLPGRAPRRSGRHDHMSWTGFATAP